MRRTIVPLLSVLSGAALCLACGCRWFDSAAQMQELYDQSEKVFIGRAIAAVAPRAPGMSRRVLGSDVLLQVTSRKKGQLRRDTVLVLQDDTNCARQFIKGDTYYVFARSVRQVQALSPGSQKSYAYFDVQRQVFFCPGGRSGVRRYQQWAQRFPTVTTNQCVAFAKGHPVVPAFFQGKADL